MNTSSCSSSQKSSEHADTCSLEQAIVTTERTDQSEASMRHVNTRNFNRDKKRSKMDKKNLKYSRLSDPNSNLTKSAYSKAMGSNREEILTKCKKAIENLTFEIE